MYQLELFDVHCHIMEPSCLVPEKDFIMPDLENSRNILRIKRECGLTGLNIPSITLYADKDLVCNPLALYAKYLAQKTGETVFSMAGIRRYVDREKNRDMVWQAEHLLACGFDGFKMICKPNVRRNLPYAINDPVFHEFYGEAEKKQWPILFHVGDPETFWQKEKVPVWAVESGWFYGDDKRIPSYERLYEEVQDVLDRYPNLNITFAHFFFLSSGLERAQRMFDCYPNIRFDVTPGSEMYENFSIDTEKTREFFVRNRKRILFGTDTVSIADSLIEKELDAAKKKIAYMRRFFETDQEFMFESLKVKGIHLDYETCRELYSDAARRFLGKDIPQRVTKTGLLETIDNAASALSPSGEDTEKIIRVLEGIKKSI